MEFNVQAERNESGVRVRRDGKGDEWANLHRDKLETFALMQDLDAIMGHISFAKNTTDQLFVEYVPDRWENRHSFIREFATVAMFDRKSSRSCLESASVSAAYQLHLCRVIREYQQEPPMFFFVIPHREGFEMVRVHLETAEEIGAYVLPKNGEWREIWQQAGLISLRNKLRLFAENRTVRNSVFSK